MDKKLVSNMKYNLIYQSLVVFYPLLTTPVISRALGAEGVGIYSYTYAIAYYFSLFAALGIQTYGNRLIASSRDNAGKLSESFWELYSIQLLCGSVVVGLYLIFVFGTCKNWTTTWILQGGTILIALVDISWYFNGLEEFRTMVLRNTAIKVTSLIAVFLFIQDTKDLNTYIVIVGAANIIGQLSIWPVALRRVGKPENRFNASRKHMSGVLRLFIPIMAMNAYILIDKMVLGIFRPIAEVGHYENCDKLIRMPIGLASAVSAVMLPRAAYVLTHGGASKNNELIVSTFQVVMLFALPVSFGLGGVARELVPWYLGEQFAPCIQYIPLMCPLIVIMSFSNILRMQYFIPSQKDKDYVLCVIYTSVINFVINCSTVKYLGVYGIILGTVAGELFGLIYLCMKAMSGLNIKRMAFSLTLFLPSCLIMLIVVRIIGLKMGEGIRTNLIQAAMGALIYFGLNGLWILYKKAIIKA